MRASLLFAVWLTVPSGSAHAQDEVREPSRAEIASARRSRLGCDDARDALRRRSLDAPRAQLVAGACEQGRFRIEWIMCVFDDPPSRCGERWLTAAQRRRLERALEADPPTVSAPPVTSAVATVDAITVTEGALGDAGAGFGRWLHRAAEACAASANPSGETVTVEVVADDDHPGRTPPSRFDGASEPFSRCLRGRLRTLVWTDGTHATVGARLRIHPAAAP